MVRTLKEPIKWEELSCMHNSPYKSLAVLSLHVLEPWLTISWNEIGRCAMLEKWVLWFKVLFLHVRNAHLFSWWGSHRILAPRSPNLLTSMKYGNGWLTPLHLIAPFGTVGIDRSHSKAVPSHDTPVVARKFLNSCVFWTYMGRAQAVILKWVLSIHYHSLPFFFLIDCATGSSRSIINGPLLPLVCRLPVFNFSNSPFLSILVIYTPYEEGMKEILSMRRYYHMDKHPLILWPHLSESLRLFCSPF